MKYILSLIILFNIIYANTQRDILLSFDFKSNKTMTIYQENGLLYYEVIKHNNNKIELLYPNDAIQDDKFILNITKDTLTFTRPKASVKYTIYQELLDKKIVNIGIKVRIKNKTYDIKGDLNTLIGDLREFDQLVVSNLDNRSIRLKYYKDKEFNTIKNALKTPKLVYTLIASGYENFEGTDILDATSPIKTLPKDISKFINIKVLDLTSLSNNHIKVFPKVICKLKTLERLNMGNSRLLQNIPSCIKNLKYLTFLKIANTKITKLPIELTELKELKYLNIRDSNITNLTEITSKLPNTKVIK